MASKNVSKAQCWRTACEWALEVKLGVAGWPCKFKPPVMQKMAVLMRSLVKEGLHFNLKYLATLLMEVTRQESGDVGRHSQFHTLKEKRFRTTLAQTLVQIGVETLDV
eukprot:5618530-Amphidinium_carterae.1